MGIGRRVARGAGSVGKWYLNTGFHAEGMAGVKMQFGFGKYASGGKSLLGKAFGRLAGPAFLGYSMYQGYQEEGIWGAVKEGVSQSAWAYGISAVLPTALKVGGYGAAIGGAAIGAGLLGYSGISGRGMGATLFSPYVRDFKKKHQDLEMGTPNIDQFGTLSTMRQRSIMAIQNSKFNGRSALGNEALLMSQPYFR